MLQLGVEWFQLRRGGHTVLAAFYHLDRKAEDLKPGYVMRLKAVNTGGRPEAAHLNEMYPEGFSRHGVIYACGYAEPGPELRREHVLEFVRQDHYPHLPSRFTSFFACESADDARKLKAEGWLGQEGWGNAVIWVVEAESYFRADMGLFGFSRYANVEQIAHAYWRQVESPRPFWELLLKPPVTVIKRLE
jgi:hypothetical protein